MCRVQGFRESVKRAEGLGTLEVSGLMASEWPCERSPRRKAKSGASDYLGSRLRSNIGTYI